METLKMILENWVIFVIMLALLGLTVYAVLRFLKLTPQQQLDKIRIALLYMVTEAEKELKRKTGQVKKGYGMGLAYRKIPGYHIIFNRRKIRRTVRGSFIPCVSNALRMKWQLRNGCGSGRLQ